MRRARIPSLVRRWHISAIGYRLYMTGQLAPLANGLNQRRQKALMTLLQ